MSRQHGKDPHVQRAAQAAGYSCRVSRRLGSNSMSVDLEGARCDEESARLLPWFIAGRLSAADVERVSNHLEHCAICRKDSAHERAVRDLLKADARIEYAPQARLAKALSRIDELGRDAPPGLEQAPAARTAAAANFAAPDR